MNWDHPYVMNKQAGLFSDASNLVKGYGEDLQSGMKKGLDTWGRNFKETRQRTAEQSSFGRLGADVPLLIGGLGLGAAGLFGLKGLGSMLFRKKAVPS